MTDYPIQLQLSGRLCVVVGGGRVGQRKIAGLLAAGARVRLVTREAPEGLPAAVELVPRPFRPDDLDGALLAFAATDDPQVNAAVVRAARGAGILASRADDPEAGDFTLPAVLRRGELTLAVATGGTSPALAALLRERLEGEYGAEWQLVLEVVAALRRQRLTLPRKGEYNLEILRRLLAGGLPGLLAAGDLAGADRLLAAVGWSRGVAGTAWNTTAEREAMSVNVLLFKITLLLYFVATVLYLVDVVWRKEKAGKLARWVLVGGFAVHCATLVTRYVATGYTPVADLYESLSFFAWAIVGTFLVFDLRYRLTVLGAFSCPLALVLMIIGSASPKAARELNPMLDSWWFPVHVTLAFLGDAIFAVAAVAGVLYLVQERMLKSKKFSTLYHRLPSLQTLDSHQLQVPDLRFPPDDHGDHLRGDLGQFGLGNLLELGSQGDLGPDHLVPLRRLAARPSDHRLARAQGGDLRHHRLSLSALLLSGRQLAPLRLAQFQGVSGTLTAEF